MDPRVEVSVGLVGGEKSRFEGDHAMVVCGEEVGFIGSCSVRTATLLVPKALSCAKERLMNIGLSDREAVRAVFSALIAWGTLEAKGVKTFETVGERDLGATEAIREMAESLGVEVPDE